MHSLKVPPSCEGASEPIRSRSSASSLVGMLDPAAKAAPSSTDVLHTQLVSCTSQPATAQLESAALGKRPPAHRTRKRSVESRRNSLSSVGECTNAASPVG